MVTLAVMGKWRPKQCRNGADHPGPISTRGLCRPCAIERQTFAAVELHHKAGPTYDAWLAATRAALDAEAAANG